MLSFEEFKTAWDLAEEFPQDTVEGEEARARFNKITGVGVDENGNYTILHAANVESGYRRYLTYQ